MKRKFIAVLLIFVFAPVLFLSVQASLTNAQIIDNADLLSDQETLALEAMANSLMDRYGMDVVILTLDSLDGQSPQNKADDFYDENGYGNDGVLFLLSMEERDWYISTCGEGIEALTDYGIQQVGNTVLPYLSGGDYYGGFEAFLEELPLYFDAHMNGDPIDGYADYSGDYYHGDHDESKSNLFVSLLGGLATGGVTVLVMFASMNTKRKQRSADDYLKAGTYDLYKKSDLFLYSKVSKVRKQENDSSSSRGGGSSVHRSSGGRSHGGGGGKF